MRVFKMAAGVKRGAPGDTPGTAVPLKRVKTEPGVTPAAESPAVVTVPGTKWLLKFFKVFCGTAAVVRVIADPELQALRVLANDTSFVVVVDAVHQAEVVGRASEITLAGKLLLSALDMLDGDTVELRFDGKGERLELRSGTSVAEVTGFQDDESPIDRSSMGVLEVELSVNARMYVADLKGLCKTAHGAGASDMVISIGAAGAGSLELRAAFEGSGISGSRAYPLEAVEDASGSEVTITQKFGLATLGPLVQNLPVDSVMLSFGATSPAMLLRVGFTETTQIKIAIAGKVDED